ncbi:MAG: SDR family oxidoreductase [Anaerolineaceae bacterium]|nr:SDR family oxidoreductase [Anaerolineaceae bacterium]
MHAARVSVAHQKTILITGATSGIGREAAMCLACQGMRVIVAGRNPHKTGAAVECIRRESGNLAVESLLADLSSLAEVRRMANECKARYARLDVLVNNAGGFYSQRYTTVDGFERTFAVNYLAPFLLTNLLLDMLQDSAPARIVNVSSMAHIWGRLPFSNLQSEKAYSGWMAYSRSKMALIYFTYELARRLEGKGVTVNAVHPGLVKTNLQNNDTGFFNSLLRALEVFAVPMEQGAAPLVHLAAAEEVEGITGQYFSGKVQKRSHRLSYNREIARRLWRVSEDLCGLSGS